MEIGLRTMDVEGAEEEFLSRFQDALWLLAILRKVKELQARNIPITDVLIKEGSPPFFGVLKNFYPVIVKHKDHVIKPSRDQILRFVEEYLKGTDQDVEVLREKISLDFSILFYGKGNLRINFSRDANGLVLNIRVLDFVIPQMQDVSYPQMYENFIRSLITRSKITIEGREVESGSVKHGGLILHAGPTGSGKTTSLFAELNYFTTNTSGLIITYENPIEYRFLSEPKVRQIEIYTHLQPKYIYYHFLRNSPMVGMIAEVKTKEEFIQVLDLASRGHLVLTTIHANNALESVYMFISTIGREYLPMFLSTVRAVVCHKLVLSKSSRIVPLYEVLIPDDVIKKKIEEVEFKSLENFLYSDRGAPREVFYSFNDCMEERVAQGVLSIAEKERLRAGGG